MKQFYQNFLSTMLSTVLFGTAFTRAGLRRSFAAVAVMLAVVQWAEAQTYTMGTAPATNGATITTCSGDFYDSGGLGGNYGINQDITLTFTSPTGTPMILSFNSFAFALGDAFHIYNGPNTSSPEFATSPLVSGSSLLYIGTSGSITVRFISDGAGVNAGWDAAVFCATESTTTACTGSFMDPGGAGNYAIKTSSITHICSDNGGNARVAFSSFATEANFDFLYVYDGPTIASPAVAGSPFTGGASPGTITATGTCLTFFFISDISTAGAGWNSTISCVPQCAMPSVTAVPACAGATYNVTGAVTFSNQPTTGTLTVTDGVTTQTFMPPFTSPTNYSLTGFAPGSGMHTVTAVFSNNAPCTANTTYTAPASCGASADYLLNNASNGTTVTTCTGNFADSGNLFGNYGNSENNSISFCSGTTDQITFTFNNFATQAGSDLLYIYDGPSTASPQVAGSPFSGVGSGASPGVVSSSGTCLTFRFQTDGSTTNFGWEADISCSGGTPALPAAPTWTGYAGTACAPNTKIEGTVFEDFDNDGVKDALEPFMKSVSVSLFDNAGQVGASTTTDANGFYTFTGLTAAAVYRVEFTIPANFEEGAYGSGSGTSVQFVRAGTCSANLGLLDKGHYCGAANPKWTTPCYNNGDPMHASNSAGTGIARFDYNASGQSPAASYQNWVTFGTIGTVWGTAYRRDDATLYMSSVLRRHTGLGPGGIGAIYKRADSGTNTSSTVFYDFGALAGTVASNATRFPGAGNAFGQVGPCGLCDNLDPTTFAQVGKTGLGDIDFSTDENTMYVTNLFDRKVYSLSANSPAPGSAVALPNQPWITGSPCTNGTARPWALKVRRGVLYVGVICDGGASSCSKTAACTDLTATVYAYNGSTWSTVITFPLTYYRKAYAVGSNYWVRWMDNWSDYTANYANVTDAQFAQPIMVDIEFDDDGSMIMGFGDRTAMMTGYQAPPPPGPTSSTAERTFAHGDILRAYFNPATSVFSLENNGVAGPKTTTNPSSTSGPGGKSFYWGDYWYGAQNNAGIGALAVLPGSGEVMFPKADPIDPYASGVTWISNTNGKQNRVLEVYQGSSSGNAPNFAKNGGLGDIELHCANPPIEIGNYVWWDHNLNGRMDPSEPGIPNVNLSLYLDPNGNTQGNNPASGDEILVATTTTDAYGRYIFSFSGASNGLNAQAWQPGHTRVLPNVKYQIRINNFASDAGLTAYATSIGSAAFIMSPTQNQAGATQRDNNSYNNPGSAAAAVATGGAGENDHEFDFAFGPGGGCSVLAVPTGNTPCVGETLNLYANVSGGTAPFTYSWAGPNSFTSTAASPSIANVTAAADGTYTVTITDANSCVAEFTIAVQINSVSVTAVATDATCGMSDGSINLTVTGGITPYTYDWANNALDGTEDPVGLSAGNYPVTVTEANGCSATASANVGNSGGPTVTAAPTNPTCGLSNGSINLTVTGGGPFTFDWNVNALDGIEDPTGLAAGTYSVTVTVAGCMTSTSVVLTNTAGPSISPVVFVNTTCGLSNGSINITVSGGLAPYTFDWNVNALDGTEDPTGLAAGTYTVTVTDANTCTAMTTVVIAPSTGYTASTTQVNEMCASSNGSINLSLSGGTAPFTYDWSHIPGSPNPEDPTGLAAGAYTVTVTDANNCTATTSATLTNTAGPTATTTPTDAVSCVLTNGAIDLQVLGGTLPYFYDWNNDGHPPPDFDTEDLNGLSPGTYIVTITDSNGCTLTASAIVGVSTGASLNLVPTDPATCAQTGSVDLIITGGVAPFNINWSNLPGDNNPEDQSGLAGGAYGVTVTEANGCTVVASISIRDIREPVPSVVVTQPTCGMSDGVIDLTITPGDGVGPFTIDWSNIAGSPNPEDQAGLSAGNYTVTVTDELACTTVLTVNLNNSAAPELVLVQTNGTCGTSNGVIDMTINNGVAPFDIDWDNNGTGQTNDPQDLTGLAAGTYNISVTDAGGCTAVGTVILTNSGAPTTDCTASDETAANANDGSIDVTVDGIGPFGFAWNPATLNGTEDPTNLPPGNYSVTVTDLNGCASAPCATTIAAASLPCPEVTATNTSFCLGGMVDLASLVTGNTPAGTLTYHTSQAAADAGTGALPNSTVTPAATTTYYVRSINADGSCYDTAPMTVTVTNSPSLTVATGSVCAGSSIDLATLVTSAGGGTLSFHATLADAQNDANPLASSIVSPASATNYYVRSQTAANCYTVKEVTITMKAATCGTITVTGPN